MDPNRNPYASPGDGRKPFINILTAICQDWFQAPPLVLGHGTGCTDAEQQHLHSRHLPRADKEQNVGAAGPMATAPTCAPSQVPNASTKFGQYNGPDCDVFDFADSVSAPHSECGDETASLYSQEEDVPFTPLTQTVMRTVVRTADGSVAHSQQQQQHAPQLHNVPAQATTTAGSTNAFEEDSELGDDELVAYHDCCSRASASVDSSHSAISHMLLPASGSAGGGLGDGEWATRRLAGSGGGPSSSDALAAHRSPETGPTTSSGDRGAVPSSSPMSSEPLTRQFGKPQSPQPPQREAASPPALAPTSPLAEGAARLRVAEAHSPDRGSPQMPAAQPSPGAAVIMSLGSLPLPQTEAEAEADNCRYYSSASSSMGEGGGRGSPRSVNPGSRMSSRVNSAASGSPGVVVIPLAARPELLSRSESAASASSTLSLGMDLNDFGGTINRVRAPSIARPRVPPVDASATPAASGAATGAEMVASGAATAVKAATGLFIDVGAPRAAEPPKASSARGLARMPSVVSMPALYEDGPASRVVSECTECATELNGSVFMLHDQPYCSADCRLKGCRRESQSGGNAGAAANDTAKQPPPMSRSLSAVSSASTGSSTGLMASYRAWM